MNVFSLARNRPWMWPAVANLMLLGLIFSLSGEFKFSIITANLAAASYLAMVGLGQMFPVASGDGGIDLSVPYVMNFSAFLAVKLITEHPGSVAVALFVAICFGALVGLVNTVVILRLRVPPIIGTLAVGFVVLTFVQLISADGSTHINNRDLVNLLRGSFGGVPTPFYVVIAIAVAATLFLRYTALGRSLLAVGQNRRAAELAGTHVERAVLLAYVICGSVAGLAGVLLAISIGSADMEMGNPFLLTSVGAVVLGGSRIAGGSASVVGTVLGALLLTLLVLAVTTAGLPIEMKHVVSGLVITLVLVGASGGALRSRKGGGGAKSTSIKQKGQ